MSTRGSDDRSRTRRAVSRASLLDQEEAGLVEADARRHRRRPVPDEITALANADAAPDTRDSAVRGFIDGCVTSRVDPDVKKEITRRSVAWCWR